MAKRMSISGTQMGIAGKMKIIYDTYDKKRINELPKILFDGRIIVIFSEAEADKAVDYLLKQEILGFDTETRPSFKKGRTHQVSLLQVATHDTCFLFRLNMIGIPDSLLKLLEDKHITKVGLSLHDDLRMLSHRKKFTPGTFIELQKEVKDIGIKDLSLQKIYANLLGCKISKNQQLSNWEAETLSEAQKKYAATDAWACVRIHEEIVRMKQDGGYTLKVASAEVNAPKSQTDKIIFKDK